MTNITGIRTNSPIANTGDTIPSETCNGKVSDSERAVGVLAGEGTTDTLAVTVSEYDILLDSVVIKIIDVTVGFVHVGATVAVVMLSLRVIELQ